MAKDMTCGYSILLTILLMASVHGGDECCCAGGTSETNDYICGEGPGSSCPDNSPCMLNDLCAMLQTGAYERHTCTDSTWQRVSCPNMCLDNGIPFINLAFDLIQCEDDVSGGSSSSQLEYCGNGDRYRRASGKNRWVYQSNPHAMYTQNSESLVAVITRETSTNLGVSKSLDNIKPLLGSPARVANKLASSSQEKVSTSQPSVLLGPPVLAESTVTTTFSVVRHSMTLVETDQSKLSWELSKLYQGYDLYSKTSTSTGPSTTQVITTVSASFPMLTEQSSEDQTSTGVATTLSGPSTAETDTRAQITTVVITAAVPTPSASPTLSASPISTADQPAASLTESSVQRNTSTIVGVTIGVSLGIAIVTLLFYLLRRRKWNRKRDLFIEEANGSFQPESTNTSDPTLWKNTGLGAHSKVIRKAELNTHPNALAELEDSFNELDSHPVTSTYVPSELGAGSGSSRSVSAVTIANDNRWSVVSSLTPPRNSYPSAMGVSPMSAGLQAVRQQRDSYGESQQHHDRGGDQSDSASQQNGSRLSRPISDLLPVIEVTPIQTSLAQRVGSIERDELEGSTTGDVKIRGGEQTVSHKAIPADVGALADREPKGDGQAKSDETGIAGQAALGRGNASKDGARLDVQAAQADADAGRCEGENALKDESLLLGETSQTGNIAQEATTDFEIHHTHQSNRMQAGEIKAEPTNTPRTESMHHDSRSSWIQTSNEPQKVPRSRTKRTKSW